MIRTFDKSNVTFNFHSIDYSKVILREESPVDEFSFNKGICSDDNKECIAFTDPILVLFNQQRIAKQLGENVLQSFLNTLSSTSSGILNQLRSKCTDEQLMSLIKSRHIQQPSELMNYLQWCSDNLDKFAQEVIEHEQSIAQVSTDTQASLSNPN